MLDDETNQQHQPTEGTCRVEKSERDMDLDDMAETSDIRRNRTGLFIFSVLYTTFFAGAYLGFGPMQLMLEDDGAFSSECTEEEQAAGEVCPSQTAKLLQVILVSQATSALAPFLGYLVDLLGALALMKLLGLCGCVGVFLVMMASLSEIYELLFVAFILIGIMFAATSIMTVQTGLVFQGSTRRRVISLLNNLIDAGSVTYLLLYEAYNATGENFVAITGGYLGFAVFCFGGATLFWIAVVSDIEKSCSSTPIEETEQEPTTSGAADVAAVTMSERKRLDKIVEVEDKNESGADDEMIHPNINSAAPEKPHKIHVKDSLLRELNREELKAFSGAIDAFSPKSSTPSNETYQLIATRTPVEQLKSEQFICVVLFLICHDSRTAFTAATARDFLASLGDDEQDNKYLALFTYINVASLAAMPFVDKLLAKWGYHIAFQLVNLLAIANGVVLIAADDLNVQVVGFVIFSFYRSLAFASVFSYMPVFLGGDVVGRGIGIMICAGGVVGLINIPLASLTVDTLDGDFFWANLFYTLIVVPFIFVAWRIGRGIQKEEAALAAEPEQTLRHASTVHLKLSRRISLTSIPRPSSEASRRMSQLMVTPTPSRSSLILVSRSKIQRRTLWSSGASRRSTSS